jgi:hypothetical protein
MVSKSWDNEINITYKRKTRSSLTLGFPRNVENLMFVDLSTRILQNKANEKMALVFSGNDCKSKLTPAIINVNNTTAIISGL